MNEVEKSDEKDQLQTTNIEKSSNHAQGSPSEGIPEDILNQMSPNLKEMISFSQQSGPFFPQPPFADKITTEHITSLIAAAENSEKRDFEADKRKDRYKIIYFLLAIAFIIFLVLYLSKDSPEIFMEIIKSISIGVGGFGAGYGYKAWKNKKKL